MNMALSLAYRGIGTTGANPRVGCVLVKDGKVVGRGYHKYYGGDHAEVAALKDAGSRACGTTAYVTLEPCSHFGKTPPCAPRLIEAGVKKVVIGSNDPNPLVSGNGIKILEDGEVEVIRGILKSECDRMNRGFFTRMKRSRPWITVKAATGIDGAMCLYNGQSKWITSYPSRRIAHILRSENDAIMVGKGTVKADDPQLTVRSSWGSSPLKVVLDSNLEISDSAAVFKQGKCLVYIGSYKEGMENKLLGQDFADIEFVKAPLDNSGMDLASIVKDLGNRGINYLLVEGGASVISSLFKKKLVDSIVLFVSPRIMGRGMGIADKMTFEYMENTIHVRDARIVRIGEDLILEGLTSCLPDW